MRRTVGGASGDDGDIPGRAAEGVVDLQTFALRESPAATLASLSRACEGLGVEGFDAYGDFHADGERSYLRRFESEVARHFGKEDGVFCLSGGMAQSIALLINARGRSPERGRDGVGAERTPAFASHPTSHLLLHENDHFSELLGMEAAVIVPGRASAGESHRGYDPDELKESGCYGMEPVRLSHVRDLFSRLDRSAPAPGTEPFASTHSSLTPIDRAEVSTLILELPHRELGGKLTPWDEVEGISRLCGERGIKFHCDGARIFEASAGYGHKSVEETARPFDSVYISFYKGLGAISGAMLLGDTEFCFEARVWLRRMGGNLYSVLPYAVSSWKGFRECCLREAQTGEEGQVREQGRECQFVYDNSVFEHRREKLVRAIESLSTDADIASIVRFDPEIPETNIVHGYLRKSLRECTKALEAAERTTGIRVLSRVRGCAHRDDECDDRGFGCRFELTMGESNSAIDEETFVRGWKEFTRVAIGGPDAS